MVALSVLGGCAVALRAACLASAGGSRRQNGLQMHDTTCEAAR